MILKIFVTVYTTKEGIISQRKR